MIKALLAGQSMCSACSAINSQLGLVSLPIQMAVGEMSTWALQGNHQGHQGNDNNASRPRLQVSQKKQARQPKQKALPLLPPSVSPTYLLPSLLHHPLLQYHRTKPQTRTNQSNCHSKMSLKTFVKGLFKPGPDRAGTKLVVSPPSRPVRTVTPTRRRNAL